MPTDDMRDVLTRSMIEMRYQPIVGICDRAPCGVEALARLSHPGRGTLPPDDFVPQVEDAGLGASLTMTVAGNALAELSDPAAAAPGLRIALNVPLDALLSAATVAWFDAARREHGIAAERIVLELTERRPPDNLAMLGRAIGRVRSAGFGLSLDDVGPETANLAALLALDFTSLKLDRLVVQRSATHPAMRSFAASTIEAARARGIAVIAEGVEDRADWERMAALGADQAQGFLVSRPLPAEALGPWLRQWQRRGKPD